jgi:ketosteroid isomerase-like protein
MRTPTSIVCAAGLLIAMSAGHADKGSMIAGRSRSVAERMRQLSQEIMACYERRDTAALKGFYAKQPDALFFWERRMTYSWDQLDSTIDDLARAVAEMNVTTTEFRSGGSGNTGWFAAQFHVDRVTPAGKHLSSDGRWTVIAEKINGRWLIVHEHTSFPLPER